MRLETEMTRLGKHQLLKETLWLLAFVGYFLGLGGFFLIFRPDDPGAGDLAAAVFYVVLGASGICWLRTEVTSYRHPAHMETHADRIEVVDPSSLEQPLELSHPAIKVILIDGRPVAEKRGESLRRFPVPPWIPPDQPEHRRDWLYSNKPKEDFGLYPIGPTDEVPNVAILLRDPIVLVPSNRFKNFLCNPRVAAKRWVHGIRIRVSDPDAMRDVAERMGVLREITAMDLAALQPLPEEAQYARFLNRVQWTWLIIYMVAWVGGLVLYMLDGD
jgi:hypothetical protein